MRRQDQRHTWDSYKLKLQHLTPDQVREIDQYLDSVGDYGEVHLIVQHGELRYINKIVSFVARAFQRPGEE